MSLDIYNGCRLKKVFAAVTPKVGKGQCKYALSHQNHIGSRTQSQLDSLTSKKGTQLGPSNASCYVAGSGSVAKTTKLIFTRKPPNTELEIRL